MKEFNKTQELRKIKFKQNKNTYIKRVSIILSCVILIIGIIYFTFAKFESSSNSYTLIQGLVKYNPSFNVIGEASDIIDKFGKYSDTTDVIDEGIYETENEEDRCTYTLAYDGTVDNNLRYVGKNPCNYVSYNNELWRIIGYMNNMYTSESDYNNKTNAQTLVKLIRKESLGNYSWDSTPSTMNNGSGVNQWGESTYENKTTYEGSDFMRELNTDYLGNITVGTDGKWFSGGQNAKNNNKPSTILDANSQWLIQDVVWNTGAVSSGAGKQSGSGDFVYGNMFLADIYDQERGNETGKNQNCSSINCTDTVIRTTTWYGKIALMYISDYGFATNGGSTTSRNECLNISVAYPSWRNSSISDCKNNDWLLYSTHQKVLSANSDWDYRCVWYVNNKGDIAQNPVSGSHGMTPVLYLKSSVKITGGEGSKDNPYILGID